MSKNINPNNLKTFFIKLISITFAIIIIINVTYNLILADKLENINDSLSSAGTLSGARNVINFEQYFIIEEGTKGSDIKSPPLS